MEKNLKAKKSFIKQMEEISKKFMVKAQEEAYFQGGYVNKSTFEVELGKYCLYLRVECYDRYKDCFVMNQRLEYADDKIYQQKIICGDIEIEW